MGFEYLEKLLRNAGKPVPMVELVGGGQDDGIDADPHSRQPVLDGEARTECKEKLREFDEDIDKAEKAEDPTLAQALRKERDELQSRYEAALGLGGRDRDMNDPTNKLRARIHVGLGRAYMALREANPPLSGLADHFNVNISSEGMTFTSTTPRLFLTGHSTKSNANRYFVTRIVTPLFLEAR